MHGTSGYISAFESSKTRKIDDAIISPKSIQRRFQFISQFVSVPRASLPMMTGVDTLHQIAPNHLQSNLPTALLLNLFGFIQKGVQIRRDCHFKIRAGLHLQQLHLSPLQRGCLNFQLTVAQHLTWFPTCF
jgi:hypothetical protein